MNFSAALRAAAAAERWTEIEVSHRSGIKRYRMDALFWGYREPRAEERVVLERILPALPMLERALIEYKQQSVMAERV